MAAAAVSAACASAGAADTPPAALPREAVAALETVRLAGLRAGPFPFDPSVFSRSVASRPAALPTEAAERSPLGAALSRLTGAAEGLYRTGLTELFRGELDAAAADFAELRARHPAEPQAGDAAYWLAEIRRRQGRFEEAVAFLRLVRGPREGEGACRLAALLDAVGRRAEARVAWAQIAADPASSCAGDATAWMGADRLAAGDSAAARSYLARALGGPDLAPDPAGERTRSLLPLALALRNLGDAAGAVAALGPLLASPPDDQTAAEALLAQGFILLEAGRPDAAERAFDALLAKAPADEMGRRARFGRVRAEVDAGQAPGGPPLAPANLWEARSLIEVAWLHFRRGDYGQALRWSRESVGGWVGEGADAPAYLAAESLRRLGRGAEAVEAFSSVPGPSRFRASALLGAGLAALADGKPTAAADLLELLLRDHPGYSQADAARLSLGRARLMLGQPAEALRAYEAVSRDGPSHGQALFERGRVSFQEERWEEAATLLSQFVDAYPDDPNRGEALLALARSQFRRGSLRPALAALDRLDAAEHPDARLERAEMLGRSGDPSQARALLEGLLGEGPGGPLAARAHRALAGLDVRRGDCGAALPQFEAVLSLAPGGELEREARLGKADCLLGLGRAAEALEAYRSLGGDVEARHGAGLSLARLGRLDELSEVAAAFAASGEASVRQRGADLYGLLGRGLGGAGQPLRAFEAFDRASRLTASPEGADRFRLEAARALLGAGQGERARGLLEAVAATSGGAGTDASRDLARLAEQGAADGPAAEAWDALARRVEGGEKAEALRGAARRLAAAGRWDDARARLGRGLEACPPDRIELRQALLADLGEVELKAGRPLEALAPLGRASGAGLGSEGLRALEILARAQDAVGRGDEALETYLRIGYLYPAGQPAVARALLAAGERLEARGRPDRARLLYETAAREAPPEIAAEARQRLQRLSSPGGRP